MKERIARYAHRNNLLKVFMVLLFSLLLSVGISSFAFAEGPELVEIVSAEYTIKFLEGNYNVHGYAYDKDGQYVSYDYYSMLNSKLILRLLLSDGSTMECNGDEAIQTFGYENCRIVDDQSYETPWGYGTHSCKVVINGIEKEFDVTITPNPYHDIEKIVSVEYSHQDIIAQSGDKSTWTDEEGKEYSYYHYYLPLSNLTFVLQMKDGTTKSCTGNEAANLFGDSVVKIETDQTSEHPWGVGLHTCQAVIGPFMKEFEVNVISLEEIATIEYQKTLIEGADSSLKTDKKADGQETTYCYYNIYPGDLEVVLRFSDNTTLEGSGSDFGNWGKYSDQLGETRIEVVNDQSPDNPWLPGEHTCKVIIWLYDETVALTKEFTVTLQPSPIDHISVVQKNPIIIDANSGYVGHYLLMTVYNKDGTEQLYDNLFPWSSNMQIQPSDTKDLSLGVNKVTFTFERFTVETEVEVIENPYDAISISEEEPFQLLLTKKDKSVEKYHVFEKESGGGENYADGGIFWKYNEEDGTFSIGSVKSNAIPGLHWMEVMKILERESIYTQWGGQDYTKGNITKDNIDDLVLMATFCRGKPEGQPGKDGLTARTLESVQEKLLQILDVKDVDLTQTKWYDAESNTLQWADKRWGDGPEKRVLTYENGQYVYRRYRTTDWIEKEPWEVITYDMDLHITGIYMHDINTSVNRPGDVDGDGEVTSADARMALRGSVKLENIEKGTAAFTAADADGNGLLESADARLILRASVKLESLPLTSAA